MKNFLYYQNSIIKNLRFVKDQLESINLERGFVDSNDIFDSTFYPIISELAEKLISKNYWNSDNNNLNKAIIYKWLINLILLNYYTVCNQTLSLLNILENDSLVVLDMISRFNVLANWSYSILDASIKQHFKKNNLSITADIYTGFDTEYLAFDFGQNRLLSAQLSICGGLKLEVPLSKDYKFEGVNTLTGELYVKRNPDFK